MFEREIEETIEIAASPSEIWWQLTNFEGYPDWNPFIIRAEGKVSEGSRVAVTIKPDSMPALTLRPKIIVVDPERQLRWRGRMGVPNLFDGEHIFLIESMGVDRVCFKQRERFSGIFAPGTLNVIEGRLRKSFRAMNDALRQRAEAAHATREAARAARESTHRP